jgi:DNA mismatch endonuclease (patch repair protein)
MGLSRSEQMARIRAKNTWLERFLRSALWRRGFRYRLHAMTPGGRPDLVFPKEQLAVFIDGCFWHGCPQHYVFPRTRRDFWLAKLRANVERDQRQMRDLAASGWAAVRVWEHDVYAKPEHVLEVISRALGSPTKMQCDELRVERIEVLDATTDLERQHLVGVLWPYVRRVRDQVRSTYKVARPKTRPRGGRVLG